MKKSSYYLAKNEDSNEYVYIEYDKLEGYNIKPKVKPEDAIEVNKIVFISPEFREKLIRKKINKRITKLVEYLKLIEEDSDSSNDEDGIRQNLLEAERLKLDIINKYVKYLGNTYKRLTMKKISIIVNELRCSLYDLKERQIKAEEVNERKGRKGR